MAIARVVNGSIVEYRELDITDIPAHKRGLWLPITGTQPSHNASYQTISASIETIGANSIVRSWVVANVSIEVIQSTKLDEAWARMESGLEDYAVTVAVGGEDYQWGCDRESRENIMGINTAIALGLPIPNPRNWTPKGGLEPVSCTYTDLATIGGALLAAKDAFMVSYFTHKAAIMTEEDVAVLSVYDVTTDWPDS